MTGICDSFRGSTRHAFGVSFFENDPERAYSLFIDALRRNGGSRVASFNLRYRTPLQRRQVIEGAYGAVRAKPDTVRLKLYSEKFDGDTRKICAALMADRVCELLTGGSLEDEVA